MQIKRIIMAGTAALLPLAASAASLIIPAAGAGPGANSSVWKSEVTVSNLSSKAANLTLTFHDSNGANGSATATVAAHETKAFEDIVAQMFHLQSATGGIEIASDNSRIVVTSRTFNTGNGTGEFGQDIPAVDSASVADAQQSVLLAPSDPVATRFNFGIYAVTNTSVTWRLVRADGTSAATADRDYTAGQQFQYNSGVQALFGLTPQANDSIHAEYKSGSAIVYGSAINNISGDPTFVPGIVAKPEDILVFKGIDDDENGTVDVAANDNDSLVRPLDLTTSLFPNFFRIVAEGPNGEKVHFELVDNFGGDVVLVDDNGTVEWAAGANMKSTLATLKVRATIGNQSVILSIPANFR
jgi:hypothetical protein